jgi:hypothetical protein
MPDANVALLSNGATATAIRTDDATYVPSRGIDNNHATQWWAGSPPTSGCWFQIDLGSDYQINSHRYNVTGNSVAYCAATYKLESSSSPSGPWTLRYTSPNVAGASNPTDFTSNPTHVIPLDTPGTARYWRFTCLTGAGSDNGGWSVYDFELWGVAGTPAQTLSLPLITDGDTVRAVTLLPAQALALPKITDGDTLRPVTLVPGPFGLTLPKITDGDTLRPVVLAPGPVGLTLPKITDGDTLRPPSLGSGVTLVLPHVVDPDTLGPVSLRQVFAVLLPRIVDPDTLNPVSLARGLAINLPHFVGSGSTVLYSLDLDEGPAILSLPWIDNSLAEVFLALVIDLGDISIWVEPSHRYWGDDNDGEVGSYFLGQSVQVMGTFKDYQDEPFDPDTVRCQVLAPDGTLTDVTLGSDPLLQRMEEGVYRYHVEADQSGKWLFRWSGTAANSRATPATEGIFRVRKSKFTP